MRTENVAARAVQTGNGEENPGKSGADAKPSFELAKRRKQPERYAKLFLKLVEIYWIKIYQIKQT
jgi:hypothetical protein